MRALRGFAEFEARPIGERRFRNVARSVAVFELTRVSAAARTPAGYRTYGPAQLERMQFIKHCRSLDMALSDVRRLIALSIDKGVSCDEVNGLVAAHLERVRAKRAALDDLERKLAVLDAQCASGHRIADCGILQELIHAAQGEACACHPRRD